MVFAGRVEAVSIFDVSIGGGGGATCSTGFCEAVSGLSFFSLLSLQLMVMIAASARHTPAKRMEVVGFLLNIKFGLGTHFTKFSSLFQIIILWSRGFPRFQATAAHKLYYI